MGPGVGEGRESVFNRGRVSVWEDESSGDGQWGWSYKNVNVLNATELGRLKWFKG